MKVAKEKYGGNSLGIVVRICSALVFESVVKYCFLY